MPMPTPMQNQPMPYGQPQPYSYHQPPQQGGQYAVHYPPVAGVQPQVRVQPTVILTQASPVILGSHSQRMLCPACHSDIKSNVVSESNYMTHLIAIGLCFFGCILCSCLPYCMDSCKNISHFCPHCKAYIGTYTRNL